MQTNAGFLQSCRSLLRDLCIHHRKDARQELDDLHLTTQLTQQISKFHTDHAATDNRDAWRQLAQRQCAIAVDHLCIRRNRHRQAGRRRSGSDDDLRCADRGAVHHQRMRILEYPFSCQYTDTVILQQQLYAAGQLLDHTFFPLLQFRHIHLQCIPRHAEHGKICRLLHGMINFCCFKQCLGRDAAPV